ncbi:MAG: hypothetical protein LBT00_08090 [Spirochaetaceae bacterium]|nr:hypothetical protein [Spirochaetaceae bacterium]
MTAPARYTLPAQRRAVWRCSPPPIATTKHYPSQEACCLVSPSVIASEEKQSARETPLLDCFTHGNYVAAGSQ